MIAVGLTEIGLFLAVTTVLGVALGALIGRSARTAGATGLAACAFAMGIGHNAPFCGFGWLGAKMWIIMLTASAIASVTLVVAEAWIGRRLWFRGGRWAEHGA